MNWTKSGRITWLTSSTTQRVVWTLPRPGSVRCRSPGTTTTTGVPGLLMGSSPNLLEFRGHEGWSSGSGPPVLRDLDPRSSGFGHHQGEEDEAARGDCGQR